MPSSPLHFPAGLGINEAVQEQLIEPGQSNLRQENVRFTARGSLGKRVGFTALSTTRIVAGTREESLIDFVNSSRASGYKTFPFGTEICIIDGHVLDVWDPALSASSVRSRVSECGPVQRWLLPYPADTPWTTADTTVANGFIVTVTLTVLSGSTSRLNTSVVNATTGELQRRDSLLISYAGSQVASLVAVGSTAILVFGSAANTIKCRTLDCSSSTGINTGWTAAVTLASDAIASDVCDVTAFSDRFALVYPNNGGTASKLSARTFNAAGTQLETTTIATGGVVPSLCSAAGITGDTLWLSWNQATDNYVIGLRPTALGTVLASATLVRATPGPLQHVMVATTAGSGTLAIASGGTGVARIDVRPFTTTAGATTNTGTLGINYNVTFATRPWYEGGRIYCALLPQDVTVGANPQQNVIVCDITPTANTLLRPVATVAPRLSTTGTGQQHVPLISGSKYVFANTVARSQPSTGIASGQSLEAAILDFASTLRWLSVDYNENKYLTAGLLSYFDGANVREAGFLTRPSKPSTALVGGGAITDTGIRYVCMWEAYDASGNVEWSAISDPSAPISPAGQNVTVTVESPTITSRLSTDMRVAIYRTTNNGTIYYRVGVLTSNAPFGVNTTNYTDSTTAAALVANAQLYKSPGVPGTAQDRYCPPGFSAFVPYNGTLVGVGDDGFSLWQSAQQVIGEGTWFNPIWQWPITDDGPITALAVYDGTLFVFKRRAIYAVQGDPPNDTASQGGLGTPRKLAVDVGCSDPDGILVTAKGVFFTSERGIELLDRSLSVEWIGEAVKNTVTAFPVVTSAVLDIFNSLALFTLATGESSGQVTGTGVTVVYDLAREKWVSVDRVTNSAGTASAPAQSAAVVFNGTSYLYARLDTDGHLLVENRASYLDPNSAWVTMLVETSWLRIGLQQQQRLWELLMLTTPSTDAQIRMEFAKDWGAYAASVANKNWTDAENHSLTQFPARPLSQGQSLKVRVTDLAPGTNPVGTGQGFTLIAFSADVGPAVNDNAIHKLPHLSTVVRK